MKWFSSSKKGKEPSSRYDQSAETLRNEPAPTIQSSPSTPNRIDKYGLFLLNPKSFYSKGVKDNKIFLLDIIAFHSITRNTYDTWIYKNSKF
jgi:hypothetical protein